MKKILHWIIIFFIVIVFLFFINGIRNFIILKRIYNLNKNFVPATNYSIRYEANSPFFGKTKINYYFKDNIYFFKEIITINQTNKEYDSFIWHNLETDEFIALTSDENGKLVNDENQEKTNISMLDGYILFGEDYSLDFNRLFIINMFNIIQIKDNCYEIKVDNNDFQKDYINKETGLLQKIITKDNVVITMLYEQNNVTLEDISKPQ